MSSPSPQHFQEEPLDLSIKSPKRPHEVNNNQTDNPQDDGCEAGTRSSLYKCTYSACSEWFTSTKKLMKHVQDIHNDDQPDLPEKPFKCPVCDASFRQKHGLKLHMPLHSDEKPYPCSHCQKGFSRKVDLVRHERIHSGERPFACDTPHCGRSFVKKSDLVRHARTHTGERPYQCRACAWRFARRESLRHHELTHSAAGAPPAGLDLQKSPTSSPPAPRRASPLAEHNSKPAPPRTPHRVHTDDRTRPRPPSLHSESSSASVTSSAEGDQAEQTAGVAVTWSGGKRHQCQLCHHRFGKKSDLERHLRTHSGIKPYACAECSARFTRRDYLYKHSAGKHGH